MRRRAYLSAIVFAAVTVGAFGAPSPLPVSAQLVPLSQCGSAMPCSLPVGLRPADAAAASPYGHQGAGNALIGVDVAIQDGLKPNLIKREIAEDPSDRAARIFVKRNPSLLRVPTPRPTPSVPPAAH